MTRQPARVFVSYTHESDHHRRRILDLVERLRSDGVDARSDHYVLGTPAAGWPAWMEDELLHADFIVLICTATYNARYSQEGGQSEGLGGRWEASLVRDRLYSTHWRNLWRFVPVLPQASSINDIPEPLRVRATHYQLSDYEGLFRHLTGQPAVSKGPIGPLKKMPTRRSIRRAHDPVGESHYFSPEITQEYSRIDQRVEELTAEQYAVITQLHGRSRALISGTPGSGKTLVAAEKAIRLADAGIKTLLLCHNPLLARWLRQLTSQSMVDVRAFEDLVGELTSAAQGGEQQWSNYSQPTSTQLERALVDLLDGDPPFQAVIVDEGQDFADDWWPIVEACIPDSSEATLYVFFDERQSLLPDRMQLPPSGWPLSLSRNWRNAGRIYEVMRHLSPGSPLPDQELHGLGQVEFFHAARLRDAVSRALKWCDSLNAMESLTAILAGGTDFETSVLAHGPFAYEDPIHWQGLVRREMRQLTTGWSNELRSAGMDPDAVAALRGLSRSPNPTPADMRIVGNAAAVIASALSKGPAQFRQPGVRWKASSSGVRPNEWRLKSPTPKTSPLEILNAFRSDAWATSLPETASVHFAAHHNEDPKAIPVYHVGEIKGLERRAVLLVLQGDAPQFMHHLFVGVSRARAVLAVVGDQRAYGALPFWLKPAP